MGRGCQYKGHGFFSIILLRAQTVSSGSGFMKSSVGCWLNRSLYERNLKPSSSSEVGRKRILFALTVQRLCGYSFLPRACTLRRFHVEGISVICKNRAGVGQGVN